LVVEQNPGTVSRIVGSKAVQTLAVALGVVVLAEFLAPNGIITPAARPKIKRLMKEAVKISEELKVKSEETKETLEDLLAEAREEYRTEKTAEARKGSPEPAAAGPEDEG